MSKILKAASAAAVLAFGATIAIAQTPPAKSKSEAGAPEQGPTPAPGSAATGAAPGAPTTTPTPGTPPNPTGMSQEKQKSESNDPQQGGKKQ
jgi:hypothetical protein